MPLPGGTWVLDLSYLKGGRRWGGVNAVSATRLVICYLWKA